MQNVMSHVPPSESKDEAFGILDLKETTIKILWPELHRVLVQLFVVENPPDA